MNTIKRTTTKKYLREFDDDISIVLCFGLSNVVKGGSRKVFIHLWEASSLLHFSTHNTIPMSESDQILDNLVTENSQKETKLPVELKEAPDFFGTDSVVIYCMLYRNFFMNESLFNMCFVP
jgi:hypothetical protein